MKITLSKTAQLFLLLLAFFGVSSFRVQTSIVQQNFSSPTPTYDPLVETPLPPNPTELELGQNLYWHWCMTCHGDRGQGLTDEFRGIWEPDHQNCWAGGCHTGRRGDLGFPIPTIVPAVVDEDHLAQFTSLNGFADFLKATHPPQSPGILKDEEYHAIALFVFSMNGRSSATATPTTTPVSTPTATMLLPAITPTDPNSTLIGVLVIMALLVVVVFAILARTRLRKKNIPQAEDWFL
jgi:mono/diheme cytochrome c family protein